MHRTAMAIMFLLMGAGGAPAQNPSNAGGSGAADSPQVPSVMHWCAQHCTTLTLNNGHYGGPDSIWTVEKWTRESIVIRRTDYHPYPGVAILTGKLSEKGDSIENGTIRWTYHPCCGLGTGSFQAAWGDAINTVPGSDQERASSQPRQPQNSAPKNPPASAPYFPQMSEPSPAMERVKIDLNGAWQGYFDGFMAPKAIGITQTGDKIVAEDLFYEQLTPVGRQFFRGSYAGPGSHFQVELAVFAGLLGFSSNDPQSWQPAPVVIGDPDHFRIGNHQPFERMHRPPANDVPCDVDNKFHVYAKGAFVRGNLQVELKNYTEAKCWYYLASKLGSAEGIANLGYLYLNGRGVQKDYEMALKLSIAGAEKGSIGGAGNAAYIYENGRGVPKDPEKAQFWRSREAALRAQQKAEDLEYQKQEQGMEVLVLLGKVAASVVASAGLDSPLCDWSTATNTEQQIRRKQAQLADDGETCKDGMIVRANK